MSESQNTTAEEWRKVTIPGLEDFYSVSSLGRIRRDAPGKRTFQGRIYKAWIEGGYPRVLLSGGTRQKQAFFNVHRLVALAFLGESGGLFVNHKNGVKTDNRLENLEWVTPAENLAHASRTGLLRCGDRNPAHATPWIMARGERAHKSSLTENDVRAIRNGVSAGATRVSYARKYNVSSPTIDKIVLRKTWAHVL